MAPLPFPSAETAINDAALAFIRDEQQEALALEKWLVEQFPSIHLLDPSSDSYALLGSTLHPSLVIISLEDPSSLGALLRKEHLPDNVPIIVHCRSDTAIESMAWTPDECIREPLIKKIAYNRIVLHLRYFYMLKTLDSHYLENADDLINATHMQQALLPSAEDLFSLKTEHKIDIAAHFQPSHSIGGDFWGVRALDDTRSALYIVDFSGHGIAAALNTFRLHTIMSDYLDQSLSPGDVMASLNRRLYKILTRGQFATMFYGITDHARHTLTYSCAASPPPLLLRADGSHEVINSKGFPLAVHPQATFETKTIPFHPSDYLVLYSDALIETGNKAGVCWDIDAIISLLQESSLDYSKHGPAHMLKIIMDHFTSDYAGQCTDDLTLVIEKRLL